MKKFAAVVLAALVVFAINALSWVVLPFHNQTTHKFTDEDAVARVLKANAPKAGVYLYPLGDMHKSGLTSKQQEDEWEKVQEKMTKGPFAFVSVLPQGMKPWLPKSMFREFIKNLLAAFIIVWLLAQTTELNYWKKVIFVMLAALAGSIIAILPNWIWWGMSPAYILVQFVDIAIAWFAAGLVMAKFLATQSATPQTPISEGLTLEGNINQE